MNPQDQGQTPTPSDGQPATGSSQEGMPSATAQQAPEMSAGTPPTAMGKKSKMPIILAGVAVVLVILIVALVLL